MIAAVIFLLIVLVLGVIVLIAYLDEHDSNWRNNINDHEL